jgi:hypothetical protein
MALSDFHLLEKHPPVGWGKRKAYQESHKSQGSWRTTGVWFFAKKKSESSAKNVLAQSRDGSANVRRQHHVGDRGHPSSTLW